MASLDTGGDIGHKKSPGVKKAKKLSTRVDMTPMVDLGFLLITFFIFTATMSEPKGMDLAMPKDVDEPTDEMPIKESGTLTIMLGKDNHVYYYEGKLDKQGNNFKSSTFKEIREIIIRKKREVISHYVGNPNCEAKAIKEKRDPKRCDQQDLFVVIKPSKDARYKNAVDILDEMTINEVDRYAMVNISDTEQGLIDATERAETDAARKKQQ